MGDVEEIVRVDGVAFVLPKYESMGRGFKVGPLAAFINLSFDRFGVGVQVLEAGLMFQIGPIYFGACHIARQRDAFDRLSLLSSKEGE